MYKMLNLNKHTKTKPKREPTLTFKNCSRVCISLCTTVVHNMAQNNCDNFPSYPPDNHRSSDDVYRTGGGEAVDDNCCHCHDNGCWWCCLFAAFTVGLCVQHWLSSISRHTAIYSMPHRQVDVTKCFPPVNFFRPTTWNFDLWCWPFILT